MTTFLRRLAALIVSVLALVGLAVAGAPAALAGAGSNNLQQNEQLNPGEQLWTSNGISLTMQSDGNLVERAPGNQPVWASGTNRAGSIVRMQSDGNLVIIAPGNVAVWSTGTGGNNGAGLELQTDGNLVVYAQGHVARWANGVNLGAPASGRDAADAILRTGSIVLQDRHVSGVVDSAYAVLNVRDTAAGGTAARSAYGGAPGGRVGLDARMLRALLQIGSEGGLRVSEIAGGSHSSGSKHYAGTAFDVDQYGGRSKATVVQRCSQLGASYAADEGTHVHCQW